jgi:hypothetical protein
MLFQISAGSARVVCPFSAGHDGRNNLLNGGTELLQAWSEAYGRDSDAYGLTCVELVTGVTTGRSDVRTLNEYSV